MRFTAATLVLSLLAVSKLVVAVPPACLLAAVATEQNPADLNTLCGSDSDKVQQQIVKLCGGATQEALKAYSSTCSGAGKTVSIISASSSAKPTGSPIAKNSTIVYTSSFFDSSCSCTKTTEVSTTTAVTSFASASATATSGSNSGSSGSGSGSSTSATGSSSAAATGGAALNPKGNSVGSLAAAVIAMAGMAIAL